MATGRRYGITVHVLMLCWCIGLPELGAAQTCGNGVAEAPEECDDGNPASGDGCSATCQLENASARCAGVADEHRARRSTRCASPAGSSRRCTSPRRRSIRTGCSSSSRTGAIRIIKNGALLADAVPRHLTGRVVHAASAAC